MTSRRAWMTVFLGITGVALGMECWASWDSSPDTVPWTELIVRHVPGEVLLAALGALLAWTPVHFWLRYRRKSKE